MLNTVENIKLKNRKTNNNINYILDEDNNKILDRKAIAIHLNSYYCIVGENLSKNIKKKPNSKHF